MNMEKKKVDIKYIRTNNIPGTNPSDRIDTYGTYDEYIDSKGTIYYYLYNTDKLCYKLKEDIELEYNVNELESSTKKEKNEVRDIADDYLLRELGEDSKKYTYQDVIYNDKDNSYMVVYVRRLGQYYINDTIGIFIINGEIFSFSAMNRDRYESYSISDIDQESLDKVLFSIEKGEWKINDIVLTIEDESGKLIATLPNHSK
ncbi:MAG: hypothetical protein LBR68_04715 [Lachnoclostridium sp.]|nr:hypothetical protein [Lachnoclostridium sp.]